MQINYEKLLSNLPGILARVDSDSLHKQHVASQRENLAVYVNACKRYASLAHVLEAYPKEMTLAKVKELLEFQMDKYSSMLIGTAERKP